MQNKTAYNKKVNIDENAGYSVENNKIDNLISITKTGLIVYYGQTPGIFYGLYPFDYNHFITNFVDEKLRTFQKTLSGMLF